MSRVVGRELEPGRAAWQGEGQGRSLAEPVRLAVLVPDPAQNKDSKLSKQRVLYQGR